jgi:S-formylglutathione hydrolase
VPWGRKALPRYLGSDAKAWRGHDACALIEDGARFPATILIDQGEADLSKSLRPRVLACASA